MANQDTPIRLILLQSHVEQGEIISSALRNGGFAVRLSRANDLDELAAQLDSNATDIVLAAYQHPHCTLEQVSAALRASRSDAVLIASHDSVDEDIHAACLPADQFEAPGAGIGRHTLGHGAPVRTT